MSTPISPTEKSRSEMNQTPWFRLTVIFAVILISAALAFLSAGDQFTMVVVLLGSLPAALALLRWPVLGLLAVIISGMTIQYLGPGGVNVTMMIVAVLILFWVVELVVGKRRMALAFSKTMIPLLALIIIATISFGMGQIPWFTFGRTAPFDAQLGGFMVVVLSYCAFLLAAQQISDLRWLKWMTWTFVLLASVFVISSLVPPLRTVLARNIKMGGVSWLWLVAICLSQLLFNKDLKPYLKFGLMAILACSLYILISVKFNDKSGWMPALIVVGVITFMRSWRLGMALVVLGLILVAMLLPQVLETENYSLSTRVEAWEIMFNIIKANPLLGLGFANYYWNTRLFAIRGWYVEFNSHNNYVDILAQTGILGMAAYIWFFWEVWRLAWRLRNAVPEGFAKAYLYGAIGGLVGTAVIGMFGDWVLPFVYNTGLAGFRSSVVAWLLLGGVVVLENLYGKGQDQKGNGGQPLRRSPKVG